MADGVRCRLRVNSGGDRIFAAAFAFVSAMTLAAGLGWLQWQANVAPWPSVPVATALAGPVLPPGEPDSVTQRDKTFGPWLSDADSLLLTVLGSPELRPGGVYLGYIQAETLNRESAYAQAASRMTAAGWRTNVHSGAMVAERDALRLTLTYANRELGSEDVIISVYPLPPSASYTVAWRGAAFGAIAGWLLAAAALARLRRHQPSRRLGALAMAGAGVVALLVIAAWAISLSARTAMAPLAAPRPSG